MSELLHCARLPNLLLSATILIPSKIMKPIEFKFQLIGALRRQNCVQFPLKKGSPHFHLI